jgi:polyisoprenoid-binding protein YceI
MLKNSDKNSDCHYFFLKKIVTVTIFPLFILLAAAMGPSYAGQTVAFGPQETNIEVCIKYIVIGKYIAHFGRFKGKIVLDAGSPSIRSVYLDIQADSIRSNCLWCDKLVRSRRLLHTDLYPEIIFKSDRIMHDESGYRVKGTLEMHGKSKQMIFPFKVAVIRDPKTGRKVFDIKGSWTINRKDFNIVWNKVLDHGGVLVSDDFMVDWGLKIKS